MYISSTNVGLFGRLKTAISYMIIISYTLPIVVVAAVVVVVAGSTRSPETIVIL